MHPSSLLFFGSFSRWLDGSSWMVGWTDRSLHEEIHFFMDPFLPFPNFKPTKTIASVEHKSRVHVDGKSCFPSLATASPRLTTHASEPTSTKPREGLSEGKTKRTETAAQGARVARTPRESTESFLRCQRSRNRFFDSSMPTIQINRIPVSIPTFGKFRSVDRRQALEMPIASWHHATNRGFSDASTEKTNRASEPKAGKRVSFLSPLRTMGLAFSRSRLFARRASRFVAYKPLGHRVFRDVGRKDRTGSRRNVPSLLDASERCQASRFVGNGTHAGHRAPFLRNRSLDPSDQRSPLRRNHPR
jgi:hypothetical protein